MGENLLQYVTCNCQHCNGHIEFDANEFAEENSIVPCPHCGSETKLFIPVSIPPPLPKKIAAPVATPIISRFEGFFSGTSEIQQKSMGVGYPVATTPYVTEDQIKSVGKRSNDDMAVKLFNECEQDVAMSFVDARRYIADPRFKLMNPETGIRFTPDSLEAFIEAKKPEKKAEKSQIKLNEAHINKCWKKYEKLKEELKKLAGEHESQRISLTKAQCDLPLVEELIAFLVEIEKDGFVADDGARKLVGWLEEKDNSEIPAFEFLLDTARTVLACGDLTTRTLPEINIALELQLAIERVLPKQVRDPIKAKRIEAVDHMRDSVTASKGVLDYIRELGGKPPRGITVAEAYELKEKLYHQPTEKQLEYIRALGVNPPPDLTRYTAIELIDKLLHSAKATERQLQYIRDLGGNPPAGLPHADASELIEQLLSREQPTPRQIMLLRFWNRMDLAQSSKEEIASWLENFYGEDPRRKAAWEAYKQETGDDGSQHDPSSVPLGAGANYLNRISA